MHEIDPARKPFKTLSPALQDSDQRLAAYLRRHPPRPWDAICFRRLRDAVLPPAARWAIGLLFPVVLAMLVLLVLLTQSFTRVDRTLDAGPVAVVQATVLSIEESHGKNSGRHVAVGYRFQPADEGVERRSVSYTTHAAPRVGDLAEVEYLPRDPAQNRLRGLHATPMDPLALLLPALLLIPLPMVGIIVFYWWQRRFIRLLLQEGLAVDATVILLRRGGRGVIFCKVGYRLRGVAHEKRLVSPVDPHLHVTLHDRRQHGQTIRVLAHPTRFGSVYLIEPHLGDQMA